MPRKSDGEKIDALERSVSQLIERLDNTIRSLDSLSASHEKTADAGQNHRRETERELALAKRELEDLKKWKEEFKREREEHSRRTWAFGPNVVGALVNGVLAALVAYFVAKR